MLEGMAIKQSPKPSKRGEGGQTHESERPPLAAPLRGARTKEETEAREEKV